MCQAGKNLAVPPAKATVPPWLPGPRLDTLRLQPAAKFNRNDLGVVPFRQVDGVADMIVVGVGEQDRLALTDFGSR